MPRARSLLALLFVSLALSTNAATFTVTDGGESGPGTLSQAILDANANPGLDQIRFVVALVTAPPDGLPAITDPVDIDGLRANGLKVRIEMVAIVDTNGGFEFLAGSSGSSLTNTFARDIVGAAVLISSSVSGVTVRSNDLSEVSVQGDANLIESNTIFNNLRITGDFNEVFDNRIPSVQISLGIDNRVGAAGAGNRIGRLDLDSAAGTIVENNVFTGGLAEAIRVSNFFPPVFGNTIAGNTISGYATGVALFPFGAAPAGIRITGNSIYDTGIAIDLAANGPTPNDPADADTGANNLQNFPVLTSATLADGSLVVNGTLTSAPLTTYLIELFADTAAGADARALLASFNLTTDAGGTAVFTRTITSPLPAADEVVTATATNDLTNDTSELSAAVAIEAPGTLGFSAPTYTVNEADGTVSITVNRTGGSEGTVTVEFATQNGSATVPGDYTTTSGTLTFGPGVTTQTFDIPIVSDAVPEPEETFTATLSGATGGATLGTATTTVVIASHLPAAPIPAASTWAMLLLIAGLAAITLARIGG